MKIYIVISDGAYDFDTDTEILGAYTKKEDAVACLKKKADAIRGDWDEEEIEVDTPTSFCACWKGRYNENHAEIYIHEEELK